ncbi:MAG: Fic family protein [Chlamydiota bacterium]|nr:Fic family protein [Chlamydiota bacterium]
MYSPKYSISNKLIKSINKIVGAHALIMNARLKPKWEAGLRHQALVKSVHSSTHLEGNPLTQQEVDQVLRGKKPKRQFRKRDILEVTNYREVLQYISDTYKDPKLLIDEKTILRLHHLCVKGIEGMEKEAGRYRTVQNCIVAGVSRIPIYTPPPPRDVPKLMKELVEWIQDAEKNDVSPFIISAIAHYEFESIHPFVDGNGRAGRALATLILYKMGYDTKSFFSLEEYFDTHPDEYYGNLKKIRNTYIEKLNPDLTEWTEFFISTIEMEMTRIEVEVREYLEGEHLRKQLRHEEINQRQFKAVKHIQKQGFIQTHEYIERFKCSRDTAVSYLNELVERGILVIQGAGPQVRYVLK